MTGLPDVNRTHFSFDVQELRTEAADIADIVRTSPGNRSERITPRSKNGTNRIYGPFRRSIQRLRSRRPAAMRTGKHRPETEYQAASVHATRDRFRRDAEYERFRIGSLLGIPKLDRIALKADVTGQLGSALRMKAQAQIPLLEYNGYAYNDIVLNGNSRTRSTPAPSSRPTRTSRSISMAN
ncbi:MAG: hypothetical protein ACLUEV_07885 [Alistipes sp.]